MEYRTLGRTGIQVSCLCFGTDNFADPTPEAECVQMIDRALDAGINLMDTGDVYAEGEGERVTERGIEVAAEFAKIAENKGITPAQLAILWCKDQPGITAPLIGPRTMEHLDSLLPVAEMSLDDEIRQACDQLVPPGSAVANFFNTSGWMKMKIL